MKQKIVLFFVFVCTFMVTTQAQIGKGSVWLGGNVGYSMKKGSSDGSTKDSKNSTLNISPAIGIAVKDNLVVGISANYYGTTNKPDGSNWDSKDKTYGGGIFIRKYFPIVAQLYLFGEADAFYRAANTKEKKTFPNGGDLTTKGWDGGLSLTPGLSYGLTKYIQIEGAITNLFQTAYQKRNTTASNPAFVKTGYSTFNTGVNLDNSTTFAIGFRFLINKKA